jgi:hypothetical protein
MTLVFVDESWEDYLYWKKRIRTNSKGLTN